MASSAAAGQFNAETFTLANGLQVVVVPSHRTPAVTQMLWYKAGAYDDPPGKSGVAHFLEHMMFRGTKNTPPGDFSRLISETGGRDNALTDSDYTAYYQTIDVDRLDLIMRLEAERMTDLTIAAAQIETEREVIIEERRTRIDNVPAALLDEQSRAALFLNNHHRVPTIGWQEEMRGLGADDVALFYRTWYAPNNAVLVIAGDVQTARVRELAEKYYGPIPSRLVPARQVLAEPPKVAGTRLEMTSNRAAEPHWSRSYLAPNYIESGGHLSDVASVLAEYLGGGASAPLYRHLVVERKLALTAGASYNADRDAGTFSLFALPRPGVSIADLEAAIAGEIADLVANGASADEIARVIRRMQASAIYRRDSLAAPARIIGAALASGRSLEDVESWPERIGAIKPEEVTALARRILSDRTAVTSVLLPERAK